MSDEHIEYMTVAAYGCPPWEGETPTPVVSQSPIIPQLLPTPSPLSIIKDNVSKLTRAQRDVLRKLLDAHDALDSVEQ